MILHTTKYKVTHPELKQLIKYFWVMQGDEQTVVNHKLLPVNSIDVIISLSSPITYITSDGSKIMMRKNHLVGLRDAYLTIHQKGPIDVIGISFFSEGLYPFVKIPVSELKNKAVELEALTYDFTSRIEEKIKCAKSAHEKIQLIEEELLRHLNMELAPERKVYELIQAFYRSLGCYNIGAFCDNQGISTRRLERYFEKYVGMSPRTFQRVSRFQYALNKMIYERTEDLTALSYASHYYDQNHFIKDFKAFTACTPTTFLRQKKAVKQIMKLS